MSRTGLFTPRRTGAVSRRPAPGTRLLPGLFPHSVLHTNTHNKRCPKTQRLRLRSDQPSSRPQYCLVPVTGNGRFLNSNRLALLRGQHCRISAPVPGRIYVAGIDLAGESEQPGDVRLQGFKPTQDSTVVTIGELQMLDDGFGSRLPALTVVERHWWTGKPHTETYSGLVHLLKNVWGCRRVVVDATGTGAGVAAFLPKTIGPSIVVPFTFTAPTICTPTPIGNPSRGVERPASVKTTGGLPTPGEGPLTLKPLEGSSGGGPHPTVRLTSYLHPPHPSFLRRQEPIPPEQSPAISQLPSTPFHHSGPRSEMYLSLPASTKLGASACAMAQALAPVFSSPSPLKALRERGIKGERVPLRLLRPAKSPEIPLGVVQSKQL